MAEKLNNEVITKLTFLVLLIPILIILAGVTANFVSLNNREIVDNREKYEVIVNNLKEMLKGYMTGKWISPAGVRLETNLMITPDYLIVEDRKFNIKIDNIDIINGIIKFTGTDSTGSYLFQFNKQIEVAGYVIALTFDKRVLTCENIPHIYSTCTRLFYFAGPI